jgi:N utilization substance protein A
MYLRQTVVDDEPIDENEVNIAVARIFDPNAYVGGTIQKRLNIDKFGRAAALSAKQSIKGDLRDISRAKILEQFQDKEFDCITCQVTQVEPGGAATLVYDKTEIYLFRNEQIPGEVLHEGQMIKVYITSIANKQKKPIIKISRVRKELVKRLFELNVPEIYEGIVEIKAISREAGSRTKIAVWSNDPNVDAVGACIGPKRSRISAIVNELNGEKIDIIPYSEKPEEFIARSLAPATVLRVDILTNEENDRTCSIIVPNHQLSLAIGNRGQNAKLAAKLTGFKIDIKPEFEIAPEEPEEETPVLAEETAADAAVETPVADADADAEVALEAAGDAADLEAAQELAALDGEATSEKE